MNLGVLRPIVMGFNYFILAYALYCLTMEIVQTVTAIFLSYREARRAKALASEARAKKPELVPISIIVPAHNESMVVLESLQSFLSLSYPLYEVILVNDGSKDDTLEKVLTTYSLKKSPYPVRIQVPCATIRGVYRNPKYPNLVVVDKESAGYKADASNAGINVSRYPYFVGIDADCLLDEDSLTWISRSFMADHTTKAVGGMIQLSNGTLLKDGRIVNMGALPKSKLARFQIVEYLRCFLVGRMFWSEINALMIISGAFGAFEKETAIAVGGYSEKTAGEDMELVVKIHRYMRTKKEKYKIAFSPHAICWTQAPETSRDFMRQRRRWTVGNMQVIHRHKDLLFNPKYGTVGLLGMPYYLLYEYLGALVLLLGILFVPLNIYFELVTMEQVILLGIFAIMLGIIMSLGALIVSTNVSRRNLSFMDFLILIGYCVLENFIYRPFLLVLRLQAMFGYKKYLHVWDSITRQAFDENPSEDTSTDA